MIITVNEQYVQMNFKRCRYSFHNNGPRWLFNSRFLLFLLVSLLFIFPALCLAVGTVPEEKDHQPDDEDDVWNDDGRNDGGQVLGIVVRLNHYPRIDFAVGK